MPGSFLLRAAAAALLAAPAFAAPVVAVDIPPVHSLAARVMAGVGEPALIVTPGASPHGYAMRPSEAALLQSADVVIRVGEALTPWLERSIATLAPDAASLRLIDAPGTVRLPYREGATFGAHDHDHDHDHDHEEDHGAGEAGDHDPAPARAHAAAAPDAEDHGHAATAANDHGEGRDHDHAGVDPHAWLDPENGKRWLEAIAAALSATDPDNAAQYARNAADAMAEIDALIAEIAADLAPLRGRSFVVFHDAYHYFEARFGVEAAGAIALSDAAAPGPARVAEIRDAIGRMHAACVFAEPQFEPALVRTVTEGTEARAGVLDPLGAALESGPDLYPTLMRNLRDSLVDCLGP